MKKTFSHAVLLRLIKARDITLLLHLPKSGGTTIKEWFRADTSFYSLDAESLKSPDPRFCVGCGTFCDRLESSRLKLQLLIDSPEPAPRVFIDFGHVSISEVCDFVEQLRATNLAEVGLHGNLPRLKLLLPYRSQTARLLSYFRHYWDRALVPASCSGIQESHKLRNKLQVMNDSEHYRMPDGQINSKLWLEAFIKFGIGQAPFQNSQIFRLGDLHRFYRLSLFPVVFRTEDIDEVFFGASGSIPPRENVSEKFPEVERALSKISHKVRWHNFKDDVKNLGTALTVFILTFRSKLPKGFTSYGIHFDKNEA